MMPNHGPAAITATGQRIGVAQRIVLKLSVPSILLASPWILCAMLAVASGAQGPSENQAKEESQPQQTDSAAPKSDSDANSKTGEFKHGSWPFEPLKRTKV